ncbi:MAG TPA: YihY/virulence factor BrkB family protein [Nitrospirae bacterium]|nr:YihY/virulence factor BrkB family protein [Nitrospirota bacterium]HDZ88364.1 YihY/virulence factor BrkB family protein [Nitrospirota bacterium]
MNCVVLLFRSIKSFIRDRCSILAASMSFYIIMAIVPFCLFLMALVGFFLGENPAMKNFILSKILATFPEITKGITGEIAKLVTYRGLGIFSFIIYASLSYLLMNSVEFALNAVLKTADKRAIHHSILISFGIITIIILLLLFSFALTTIAVIPPFLRNYLPNFEISVITGFLFKFIIPLALMWLIISILYLLLPFRRPKFNYALKAAFFVSIMLEFAKHIFTWYIGNVAKLGHIYGSLTAFIIFFLWIYYSSSIFLVGAEMINILSNKKEEVYEPSYW